MSDQSTVIAANSTNSHDRPDAHAQSAVLSRKSWTGNINATGAMKMDKVTEQLCKAFNTSPFFQHLNMQMLVIDEQINCVMYMDDKLIGNVAFQILHGGVAATPLDSIGGIVAMAELYKRAEREQLAEVVKKVTRLATVDMRVDYISPGRGKQFIGTAEVLRMGRKGCTIRMHMHNDEGKLIATGIAAYAY